MSWYPPYPPPPRTPPRRRPREAYELIFRLPQVQREEQPPVTNSVRCPVSQPLAVEGFLTKLSQPGLFRRRRWQSGRSVAGGEGCRMVCLGVGWGLGWGWAGGGLGVGWGQRRAPLAHCLSPLCPPPLRPRFFKLDVELKLLRRYSKFPTVGDKSLKSKDLSLLDVAYIDESVAQPPGCPPHAPVSPVNVVCSRRTTTCLRPGAPVPRPRHVPVPSIRHPPLPRATLAHTHLTSHSPSPSPMPW
jgi:hypothetical protein